MFTMTMNSLTTPSGSQAAAAAAAAAVAGARRSRLSATGFVEVVLEVSAAAAAVVVAQESLLLLLPHLLLHLPILQLLGLALSGIRTREVALPCPGQARGCRTPMVTAAPASREARFVSFAV
jgi:hypothetical protein